MEIIRKINGIELDFHKMEVVCGTHENSFMPIVQAVYPHAKFYEPTDGRPLIYVDNGASLLSVCHLDGTMPATHFFYGPDYIEKDIRVFSPFVDDRIGTYIQLFVYPQLGIHTDLLFTVGEEYGRSTASFFNQPARRYNWMFEFDRKGTDVVHYQYTLKPWLAAIDKHFDGLKHGSFSDIGSLSHLGCQGMNIGCGYHDYTTKYGWCSMLEMTIQCQRFLKFYTEFKDTPFHHDPKIYASRGNYSTADSLPWNDGRLKPTYRSRKAKILTIKHVKKEDIKKDVEQKDINTAINEFNTRVAAENLKAEATVNSEVRKRVTALAAQVDELIEVEEPIKELVPDTPLPEDTTIPVVKLLKPGTPTIN